MFLSLSSSGLKLVATSGLTWKIYMLQLYSEWLLGEWNWLQRGWWTKNVLVIALVTARKLQQWIAIFVENAHAQQPELPTEC